MAPIKTTRLTNNNNNNNNNTNQQTTSNTQEQVISGGDDEKNTTNQREGVDDDGSLICTSCNKSFVFFNTPRGEQFKEQGWPAAKRCTDCTARNRKNPDLPSDAPTRSPQPPSPPRRPTSIEPNPQAQQPRMTQYDNEAQQQWVAAQLHNFTAQQHDFILRFAVQQQKMIEVLLPLSYSHADCREAVPATTPLSDTSSEKVPTIVPESTSPCPLQQSVVAHLLAKEKRVAQSNAAAAVAAEKRQEEQQQQLSQSDHLNDRPRALAFEGLHHGQQQYETGDESEGESDDEDEGELEDESTDTRSENESEAEGENDDDDSSENDPEDDDEDEEKTDNDPQGDAPEATHSDESNLQDPSQPGQLPNSHKVFAAQHIRRLELEQQQAHDEGEGSAGHDDSAPAITRSTCRFTEQGLDEILDRLQIGLADGQVKDSQMAESQLLDQIMLEVQAEAGDKLLFPADSVPLTAAGVVNLHLPMRYQLETHMREERLQAEADGNLPKDDSAPADNGAPTEDNGDSAYIRPPLNKNEQRGNCERNISGGSDPALPSPKPAPAPTP